MNDYSMVLVYGVVCVAFIAGYVVVSVILKAIREERYPRMGKQARDESAGAKEESSPVQSATHLEDYYRSVLGLPGVATIPEIKQSYRERLAKYHPDKVQHLGPEFREIAENKTREIIAAYEFFRRQYKF